MDDRTREMLARRRALRGDARRSLTADHFPEQRAFNTDPLRLTAALCGRRAGKTRGRNESLLDEAAATRGGRFLVINTTGAELRRLNWIGNRGDGIATLVQRQKLPAVLDNGALTVRFPDIDSWIYLVGVDDEASLRKALGGAYHGVWWDEAQKIPPRFEEPIREVLLPSLLDFGGRLRLTGSPSRQTNGLFYHVTRPEVEKRLPGWGVHEWNLLANPFFGRTVDERMVRGMLELQALFGGPTVAPMDSPIMQREGFGRWTYEATSYVYAVRAHTREALCYAPHRVLAGHPQAFPDIITALGDLPMWKEGRPYFFSLGGDLGFYPDPFGITLWAWSLVDPYLYELCSWKQTHLTSDAQAEVIQTVQALVACGMTVLDAGGPAKPTVVGWIQGWRDRNPIPAEEADKHNKHTFIELMNTEIRKGYLRFRDGGPLLDEMWDLQWSTLVSSTGRLIEDPTQANHCSDAGLYAHRHSYAHRWRPAEAPPAPEGSPAWALRLEAEMEDIAFDGQDD